MMVYQQVAKTAPAASAIQMKTRIGPVDDPLEREADRIADAVVSGVDAGPFAAAAPVVQRKCAACESEERTVQRKSASGGAAEAASASAAAGAVTSGGVPLSARERAYFEPRFGRDLSDIKLHTHGRAAQAARSVNARAYALGQDIAFSDGEYQPETIAGRRLIAHELAHTVQQNGAVVRRITYGTANPPAWAGKPTAPVPEDEKEHVDEAIALVDAVVADPGTYTECHDHFAEHCPQGSRATLAATWGSAVLWRVTGPANNAYAWGSTGGTDIGYTSLGYDQGAMGLAATLMHEAGHNCGIAGDDTHWHAELVSNYCMGPGRNEFSISAGVDLVSGDPLTFFSYRRFLGDWAGGRLRATLGADLSLMGLVGETARANRPEKTRPPGEFGSVMAGVEARAGGWGGTRYGGFSFRFETGFGAGRFALTPANPGDPETSTVAPDWILQVGPRAEFLIKMGDAHVFPLSIGAAYRLAQPLNAEAEALQGVLGTAVVQF